MAAPQSRAWRSCLALLVLACLLALAAMTPSVAALPPAAADPPAEEEFNIFSNCIGKNPVTGAKIDLNPLYNSKVDYTAASVSFPDFAYRLNVCGPMVDKKVCRDAVGSLADPAVCEYHTDGGSGWTLVTANTDVGFTEAGNPTMFFRHPTGLYSANVTMICKSSAGVGQPVHVNLDPINTELAYFVWETKYACAGSSGGISGGGIFLIILFVPLALYLIGGVLYNKFKLQLTGMELIPNVEFWTNGYHLFIDGCRFTYQKVVVRGE
ncbi:hypothetical protein H696_03901 [Fonticula alba]|uniref:Autophagy-related protein 27 n=1 Tax=Fonticula alba TaxID=691883 RepID=A0A058Z7K5_FONAL|nr:hypothetical protein H696_03901 [Fonticula alba]KCV69472.1 hypothetical protein H696_03901 [Fonticula alba]|eukprot:XP_009496037.1 hypothetical protein H696_03901 [Fonticula alba]